MPYSLVINFVPRSPLLKTHLNGRNFHALFLDLVSSVDKDLGTQLHQQQSEKAFTLSPVQIRLNRKLMQWSYHRAIAPGTPCWWRITLLDDSLFGKLAHLWLNINRTEPWQLGSAELDIISILSNPQSQQPWANFISYTRLYEQALDGTDSQTSQQARKINFRFCTPTTFRKTQYDVSLPDRDLIFRSLLKRWNQYSEIPLEFTETIFEPIYPSFFDIRTEMVSDKRSKFIGCVGEMSFSILGDVNAQIIKQINTLADFSFYAGIGRKTPMGMGQVSRY
ncbi:CRISPR-associated endoribonuclease Cas6 [Picosynechococcus sp. PCC 7117]|uniref:CRISPR-associated endoribonuclease Cas6 n=1 Tax=Picosynechococcus sp. PCC 7117 TaxID=195498 RepID=UPI000810AC7E|nr:CRISPR-associated endoribonuclease Cas6 [Picosynechococcus sp. PCC 7117]ANV89138.1 CRISPR-associated endoribonuclease Cas6 [Picosynechococcus sp. PCC 7117]